MTNTRTALASVDKVGLMARLEPEQQLQLFRIEQGIFLEDQRRHRALELEYYQSGNASILADKEHQNKLAQIRYQADREDQRVAIKGQAAVTLANKEHENQLEQVRVKLQNQMALAEFNTGLSVIPKLMEEDGKGRTSILARMENSHKVRDEVFKMQAGAVIEEKLAQKQHHRDLEKMQLTSSLKQSEQYFQSICLRLSNLLDDSKEEKVKKEIDQLAALWEKEEDKDDKSL